MNFSYRPIVLFLTLGSTVLHAADRSEENPWAAPRSMDNFSQLLSRSPFSLPTVEETSPLAERFSLTGAVTLDGETQVFVFDKTSQNRERLTTQPNGMGLELVEYLPDPDPRNMRATIRWNGQTGTINFMAEAAPVAAQAQGSSSVNAAASQARTNRQPGTPPPRPTEKRRIIRRTLISGSQSQ